MKKAAYFISLSTTAYILAFSSVTLAQNLNLKNCQPQTLNFNHEIWDFTDEKFIPITPNDHINTFKINVQQQRDLGCFLYMNGQNGFPSQNWTYILGINSTQSSSWKPLGAHEKTVGNQSRGTSFESLATPIDYKVNFIICYCDQKSCENMANNHNHKVYTKNLFLLNLQRPFKEVASFYGNGWTCIR